MISSKVHVPKFSLVELLAAIGSFCFAFEILQAQTPSSVDRTDDDNHVIVVSLDGLAAYLVDDTKAPLPTVRKMATAGCIVEGGMKVSNPSVTWPNHTSMITGVRPEKTRRFGKWGLGPWGSRRSSACRPKARSG